MYNETTFLGSCLTFEKQWQLTSYSSVSVSVNVTKQRTLLRRVHIVTKCVYWLRHVRLSACNSETHSGKISVKFGCGGFYKICRDIPNLLKIGQKCRAYYVNTLVFPVFAGNINSPWKKFWATPTVCVLLTFTCSSTVHYERIFATVVTWTRRSVTLHQHNLSCWRPKLYPQYNLFLTL